MGAVVVAAGVQARYAEISEYQDRVQAVYAGDPRREALTAAGEAARQLATGVQFLSGQVDAGYREPTEAYASLDAYREFYAAHCAEMALHHLLWAEYSAGFRDHASVLADDPFSQPVF